MTIRPALIGVDWGTSTFRAYLLAGNGAVIDRVSVSSGIRHVVGTGFMHVLMENCGQWLLQTPGLPVVMCGMIGSQQGWIETAYVSGASGIAELAASMTHMTRDKLELFVVPGVQGMDFNAMPDVMRGEETMLAGAIAGSSADDRLVCLPGTHSKWVSMQAGRIGPFASFMSGELFALLSENSILAELIISADRLPAESRERSFVRGLELAASASDLLHQLFTIRALALTGDDDALHAGEMLSGLLVGTELASIGRNKYAASRAVLLVASGELASRYKKALLATGWSIKGLDAEQACIAGIHAIATSAGILSPETGNAPSESPECGQ